MKTKSQANPFIKKTTKRKILIIDDNKDLVEILLMAFKLWGHEVRYANDGLSGINISHTFIPEIVILDIGMPGMDGYEVCKVMRADPQLKDTMFIAETGWGTSAHLTMSKKAGFHHHLVKPFNLSALHELLESK